MASERIFGDGRRFHQTPPGVEEVNGHSPETPRFPGVGEDWVYRAGANNFEYVGTDPDIIHLKRALPFGINGAGK